MKKALILLFSLSSVLTFGQNNILISSVDSCNEFITGPNSTWPYVLVATTVADGAASQGAQTFTMNVTSLPAGGANFRVYKTTANGSDFFGSPVALTLGANSITVSAVTFDRAVKFQFSSGDVQFDALSLNGADTECIVPQPPPPFSLISDCDDFISGPSAWPYVLVATTIADGAASQGAQTFTMNVTSLPTGGANFRVYKTTANGSDFFGSPVALTLGANSITVSAVTFDRAVKFQFSSGDVEFDALSLNGADTECVVPQPPPPFSLISDCDDFISGPSAWPYVLVATTIADGAASQGAQTFTMNVTSLPAGGANFRVYKTTANGSDFFGSPVALTLGANSITVSAVTFDRAVKFQFSSGDVEFDALSLNGADTECICSTTSSIDFIQACNNYTWIDGNTYTSSNNTATYTLVNALGCDSVVTLNLTISSNLYFVDVVEACDSYTWIDGITYTSSNNTATQTLVNVAGCDSVVALDLTIVSPSFSVDSIEACDSYTWIDGITYTSSNNTATQTLVNVAGCDSVVTLDLTVISLSSAIDIINDSILQAQFVSTGTNYQWVDCNDNFNLISGETNAAFITQNAGDYAVEISLNNCSVISDCFTITSALGDDILDIHYDVHVFPNPTTNNLAISLQDIDFVNVIILDALGKVLFQQNGLSHQNRIDLSAYVAGIYFLKIITPEGSREIRIIKQ